MWAYATCCMSQGEDQKPVELHMFSPYQTDAITELLVVTAHYHRTASPLGVGHSVYFGRPWIDGSTCAYGLISLPYLDGPSLEILALDPRDIYFYWLLPVTHSEIDFKKRNGTEALEAEFDRARLDYLNPKRQSVV